MAPDNNLSLGEYLRQERERRGITIEQVASATKIGVRILHSLETDNFTDLPAKPFIRGFVISYARFIGLDPKETLSKFNDFIDKKAQDRPNRDAGHSGYAFEKQEVGQSRTMLWALMGSFIVLGGIAIFVLKPSLKHHRASHVDKLRAVHTPAPVPTATMAAQALIGPAPSPTSMAAAPAPAPVAVVAAAPTAAPKSVPTATPAPATTPVATASPSAEGADPLNSGANLKPHEIKYKIIFKALERVWVRYQVDQRPMNKIILGKEKILVLRATTAIKFQASNPQSLLVNVNGRGFKALGDVKGVAMRQNSLTLFVPSELAETTQEPFPGEKPLPFTAAPNPTPSPALSTPNP